MEAIQQFLIEHGATIAPLTKTLPGAAIVGFAGRDVICYMTQRTPLMQGFAQNWRGVPPVDLLEMEDAEKLLEAILSGEFDEDSKMEGREIVMRMKLHEPID